MAHKHAFVRNNQGKLYCKVQGECKTNGPHNKSNNLSTMNINSLANNSTKVNNNITINIQTGFRGLGLLKTTQSGFINFHKCPVTTLPSDTDRFVGTSVDAEWSYDNKFINNNRNYDYNEIVDNIKKVLINTFTGPADIGIYSPSVQKTLYEMANAALRNVPMIDKITLYMPNLHFLAFPTEKFGLPNKDSNGLPDVFYPIDEPHGMIKVNYYLFIYLKYYYYHNIY